MKSLLVLDCGDGQDMVYRGCLLLLVGNGVGSADSVLESQLQRDEGWNIGY
jgi:hypothetical protein